MRIENIDVYIDEEGILKFDVLGNKLRGGSEYVEYCKNGIKRMITYEDLKRIWQDRRRRLEFKRDLAKRGIDLSLLAKVYGNPDVDEFDLLAHIVFNAPVVSRGERARALLDAKKEFEGYGPDARNVLLELVDRYKMLGIDEITTPKVFDLRPFDKMGGLIKIIEMFSGIEKLKEAIRDIEGGLYPEFGGLRG